MILMIDNFDSFTYNLVQLLGKFDKNIRVVRNDEISVEDIWDINPDHIVISPGPCTPNEAGISMDIVRRWGGIIPILGVCLGHQAIAQVFGAQVVQTGLPVHGKTGAVVHDGRSIFAALPTPMTVMRYHSLVVDDTSIPDCLEVSSHLNGMVMGVRHRFLPCVEGVQFHPESFKTVEGENMLGNFLRMSIPSFDESATMVSAVAN